MRKNSEELRGFGVDITIFLILFAVGSVIVEVYSIWKINNRLSVEHDFIESRGNFGDQFEEWAMRADAEGITKLEALTKLIGHTLFQSQKFSTKQAASVDARLKNNFSDKILTAVQREMPVGYQVLFGICEKAGIDLEEVVGKKQLPALIAAIKENRLDELFAGQPLNNGASRKW